MPKAAMTGETCSGVVSRAGHDGDFVRDFLEVASKPDLEEVACLADFLTFFGVEGLASNEGPT